jgi:hypothetical protein
MVDAGKVDNHAAALEAASQDAVFKCNTVGHRAADCKKNGNGGSGSANIAMMTLALSTGTAPRKGLRDFVFDGAMTCGHLSSRREHVKNLKLFPESEQESVGGVGGDRIKVLGRGDVELRGANDKVVVLKNVGYAPDSVANLIAIRSALTLLGSGSEYRETARSSKIIAGGQVLLTGSERGGLMYADLHAEQDFC